MPEYKAPLRDIRFAMTESTQRQLLHTRQVICQGYRRSDGLWEIEGRMSDLKNFPMTNPDRGGLIALGEPLHNMTLVLVIDRSFTIQSVRAAITAAPFTGCPDIADTFRALEGLSLSAGFNRQAKELLGGVKGCTHLLELLGPIATTAYQTLWQSEGGYIADDPKVAELLSDSCHSLARDGEVMKTYTEQLGQSAVTHHHTENTEDLK